MKASRVEVLWAPIVRNLNHDGSTRSEWIVAHCLRRTRRDARAAHAEDWKPVDKPARVPDWLAARTRYARVYVTTEPPVECVPTGDCMLRNK